MKRLAALCVVLAAAGCNPQPAKTSAATPSPAATPSGLPPITITGHGSAGRPVHIVEQSGNRKEYAIDARSIRGNAGQNIAQSSVRQATVTFYGKDGSTMTARAPSASIDEHSKLVTLSGGVAARNSAGATLTCRTLAYDSGSGLLTGTGDVVITVSQSGGSEHFTGNRFTSDIRMTRLVMR